MSGFLGLGTALAVASAADGVLGGDPVTLGGVGFSGTEVPEHVPFGGEQAVASHRLPGGGKVVDVLGAYERDISWNGMFSGTNAVSRARDIDALRKAGNQITLTWGTFQRTVVIKSFAADYRSLGYLIPYEITLEVISAQDSSSSGILDSIVDDIGSALGISGLSSDLMNALATVQSALPIAGILTKGSSAYLSLASSLTKAQSVAQLAQGSAGSTIESAASSASALGSVFASSNALAAVSAARTVEASSTEALGYISRSITNLGML